MNNHKRRWSKGFMFFLLFIPAILFLGLVVMWLWNAILPGVVHVSTITFPQALGLFVLSKILFGGFHRRHWGGERRMHYMKEKFAAMTPEEREQFKSQWRERCSGWRRKADSTSTTIK